MARRIRLRDAIRWRRALPGAAAVWVVIALLLAAPPAHADDVYVVRPGDTLSEIAERLAVTLRALASANAIDDPDRIIVGQELRLGGDGDPGTGPEPQVHVVRPGETLSAIAARYGVRVADLAAANGLADRNLVWAGARLMVSADAPALPGARASARHLVQPGETLSEIAVRYGVSTADLAAANGLADPDRVIAGTTLSVPGGWQCPVPGASFVNDFGVAKHDGRFHEGIDLFAPQGTPVVAPVAGDVVTLDGARGGLQFRLTGDDGFVYIGTHLDRLDASGRVTAGTVLGVVGTTGNAIGGPPHLHFELQPAGGISVNPYSVLQQACR